MTAPHLPVLLQQCLDIFQPYQLGIFVDCTLGAGGHASAILEAHPEIQTYVGIDQDPVALGIAKTTLARWSDKVIAVRGNFVEFSHLLEANRISHPDGVLMDLGVSSMQFDRAEKGFSFMREGPLDMRMNPDAALTAHEIVNHWSEEELGEVFRDYGEEKKWRRAAYTIVKARGKVPLETTLDLTNLLEPVLKEKGPPKKIHPLTRVFQALRIAVNRELDVLERTLPVIIDALAPGGILAVISFHSLEDRIVKQTFGYYASDKYDTVGLGGGIFLDKDPVVDLLTKKPLVADDQEVVDNPRSRSAKVRAIRKR